MSARRVHTAEWIAGAGGAILLISLFLPWFTGGTGTIVGLGTARLDDGYSAWTTFTVADVMLAVGALAAVALPALARVGYRIERTTGVAFAALGLAVLVMVRVLSPPEFELVRKGGTRGVAIFRDSDPAAGLWLGLAGCAAIVLAGCLALSKAPPAARAG